MKGDFMEEEKRYALLIDADNVSSKYIDIVTKEAQLFGNVTIRRIYGDWTSNLKNSWKERLLNNALSPIQQYSYTTGKNSSDAALIIDAMDILYTDNVDGFILVSSDSDFTRLAMRLRESGKHVVGMGESKTPTPFVRACEQFKTLDVLYKNAMEQKKKPFNKGGRKPKLDPRTHRYSLNLDDVENAKFLAFYDQSGYKVKAHFIKNCIFGKSFKVLRIDKSKVDYYIQLSQLFSQFRSIGILYNQTVKELHSNFAEKKALALLYKLERYTVELVKTNQQIIALTKQFEASYREEGTISAGK